MRQLLRHESVPVADAERRGAPSTMPAIPTLSILPDNRVGTMRTSSTGMWPDLVVSVKAITDPRTHHGGYDAGSFVMQANGESYLLDPGYFQGYPMDGDQTKHSLPKIDGYGVYESCDGNGPPSRSSRVPSRTWPPASAASWWTPRRVLQRRADRCRRIYVTSAMATRAMR